jgi:galactitol-specific phosphotransferase system IIC component
LSCFIAEKSLVNDFGVSLGVLAAGLDALAEVTWAIANATATNAIPDLTRTFFVIMRTPPARGSWAETGSTPS